MARDHGFHPIRVKRVIQETADTRTYVLDTDFDYEAGQFLTFKACGELRSYSMSSSPATDAELTTTVKRVPGGLVSNWMHDHLSPGDLIEATRPAGVFCLRENDAPLVAFCGGSGVTPVLSLVKTALATTGRRVRLLTADRDAGSVIFGPVLDALAARHPDRFELSRHLDTDGGYLTGPQIGAFTADVMEADFYICGPDPFMDLVERFLLDGGAAAEQIFIERFGTAAPPGIPAAPDASDASDAETGGTITIVLAGKKHTVPRHSGETLLQSARRAGLAPPFSCEAGNCATCIAQVTEGEARMQINNALDDDEIADGWVLTCQGEPVSPHITVVYED